MSTKPVIVLSPGSFAPAHLYDPLLEPLRSRGYDITVVGLLTVGKKSGDPPTLYDDAANIASTVRELADQGKDVVLIGHSYGGMPITESTKGLSKKEREAEGKKGGLVRLAYLTALAPEVGKNAVETLEGATSDYLSVDEDGWMYHGQPEETAKWVFNHLSPEEGKAYVGKFDQHSAVSFSNPLTYAGYKDIPVSWFFCEDDACVTPEHQQKGIDRIEKLSGKKVDVTRVPFDHVPIVTHLKETVDWIAGLVEKSIE